MHVHDKPADRRRADLQIQRAFIVTLAGFWTTILVVVWWFAPLGSVGVWPLLDSVKTSTGRIAPATEHDVFVSITRDGRIYANDVPATQAQLASVIRAAMRPHRDWRGNEDRNQVFVRVDKAAPFRSVRAVVHVASSAGCPRLVFLATPRHHGSR